MRRRPTFAFSGLQRSIQVIPLRSTPYDPSHGERIGDDGGDVTGLCGFCPTSRRETVCWRQW